jgi:gamma-glutamylcyclotransferase (GGCT)/AIG2-like uncharacterized protein YtfP
MNQAGTMGVGVPLFVNGEGMRGGSVHHNIAEYPFLGPVHTAAKYRFYSVGDRFPALWPATDGVSVVGELYDVPLTAIRDRFMPDEPPELELGVIELLDGTAAIAVMLRRETHGSDCLTDISHSGGWRRYRDESLR